MSHAPLLHRIPPPAVGLAAFLVAWFVQRAAWAGTGPASALEVLAGGIVLAIGVGLLGSTLLLLFARHTTVVPHRLPARLLVGGPFRFTRNPIYVGAILAYLGAALMLRTWLAIPFVLVPLAFIVRVVVPMEEAALRGAFGREYDEYCARVPRWLWGGA